MTNTGEEPKNDAAPGPKVWEHRRSPKPRKEGEMITMTIYASAAERNRIKAHAASQGMSISEFMTVSALARIATEEG